MNPKVASWLSSLYVMVVLAACTNSGESGSNGDGRSGNWLVLLFFIALATFFAWWLRESGKQTTLPGSTKKSSDSHVGAGHQAASAAASTKPAQPTKPATSAHSAPKAQTSAPPVASPSVINPSVINTAAERAATTHVATKPAAADKPATANTEAATDKVSTEKTHDTKASEAKTSESKPTEVKASDAKAAETKSVTLAMPETKTSESKPTEVKTSTAPDQSTVAVAVTAAPPLPAADVIEEDPVRAKRLADKQKKANKKSADGGDDLTIVEGIGPKISNIFHAAGIMTYAALAKADVETLKKILAENALHYHDPGTWPEQSAFAAKGAWEELEAFQSTLSGGKRKG